MTQNTDAATNSIRMDCNNEHDTTLLCAHRNQGRVRLDSVSKGEHTQLLKKPLYSCSLGGGHPPPFLFSPICNLLYHYRGVDITYTILPLVAHKWAGNFVGPRRVQNIKNTLLQPNEKYEEMACEIEVMARRISAMQTNFQYLLLSLPSLSIYFPNRSNRDFFLSFLSLVHFLL